MKDKQIKIDGVDVKDCKRRIGKNNYCRYYKRPCSENNYNCVWKKYLRKEQECEELKRKYNENLTVQKQLQEWQDEDLRQIKDLKQTIQELNESIQTCNFERTKLYQKLSKIKEFCKELMSENEEYISINQVLQIIRGEE